MKATAALRAADRNPYSWNMEFYEYPDGSGYEGRFTKCGICVLMKKLGLYDLTPALCRLDYTMSEAGGVTDFVRQYTLASGGPYCDCGYKKKGFVKAGTEAGRPLCRSASETCSAKNVTPAIGGDYCDYYITGNRE